MANLEQSLEVRCGGIDAFVTKGKEGRALMLEGADRPYRALVEAVHDGAATLDSAGSILYANKRFAEIIGAPVERLVGTSLQHHVSTSKRQKLKKLIREVLRAKESLTNVHRYSGSSRASIQVAFDDREVGLEARDFGKGMQPEALDSIKEQGSALGVGICGMRERMRQLGGTLEISSRPGHGTPVIATLPRTEEHSVASLAHLNSEAVATQAEQGVEVENKPPQRRRARKRILIADDHEMLRRGVRTMLESETDWEVCGDAVDGKDAVEKVAALDPDLVILDINMPVLNGLAAARQILRDRPRTKILIFTVHESDQTVKEIQASGAHGYLPKSRAGLDLLRLAREILEGKTRGTFAVAAGTS